MKTLTLAEVKRNEYFQTNKATNAATNSGLKLPNCTTFCMCAWHWCFDAVKKYTIMNGRTPGGFPNAKDWYSDYIYEKGSTPKIGSIAVWGATKINGYCGHVAFVKSFSGNTITVYQSNYGGVYFEEKTYTVKVGETTQGVGAPFIGFLYHPYYREKQEEPNIPIFTIGKTYKTKYVLNVRSGPGTNYPKKTKTQLTKDGQLHALANGCLKQNTSVTISAVKTVNGDVWVKIPSGWIVAYMNGDLCIE